jgi:hypothetical protein
VQLATDLLRAQIAGFVAAEGTFTGHATPTRRRFSFAVALGARDRASRDLLHEFFGCGTVHWSPRRKPHYDDEVAFAVQKLRDLVEVVVPFMDRHLPPCHKRTQYEAWRAELLHHWEHDARRRRPCTVDGCTAPQRAKGLCRRHYYEAHRR